MVLDEQARYRSNVNVLSVAIQIRRMVMEKKDKKVEALGVPTPILWGGVGEGKTETCKQLAGSLGLRFYSLILAQRDPADIGGLLVADLKEMVARALPPEFLKQSEPTLLLLDEFNRAPVLSMNAALELVRTGMVGDKAFPIIPVLAGNPTDLGAQPVGDAVRTRCLHLLWWLPQSFYHDLLLNNEPPSLTIPTIPDDADLLTQAPIVTSYLRQNPSHFRYYSVEDYLAGGSSSSPSGEAMTAYWTGLPTPRSWAYVTVMLGALSAAGFTVVPPCMEVAVAVVGLVGEGVGRSFLAWLEGLNVPDIQTILSKPSTLRKLGEVDLWVAVSMVAQHAAQAAREVDRERWVACWDVLVEIVRGCGREDLGVWLLGKFAHIPFPPPEKQLQQVGPVLGPTLARLQEALRR